MKKIKMFYLLSFIFLGIFLSINIEEGNAASDNELAIKNAEAMVIVPGKIYCADYCAPSPTWTCIRCDDCDSDQAGHRNAGTVRECP